MAKSVAKFSSYQKFVIAILAFLQFTIILDFMILSPLGATIMPALNISPAQFGWVVSVYAFSAGASGILASGFADKYDRKKLLLFFYVGFVLGTLLCGLAPTYHLLLAARMITGIFGGVIGAIVGAITTDLFSLEQRGRVMGVLQTAFAASQIFGLPAGLYFSNLWNWHAPFLMIVVISALAGILIWRKLKPITEHLSLPHETNALLHFKATITNRNYFLAFLTNALLTIGGFMIMPFSSAFSVSNLGIGLHQLPIVYLVTGLVSIVTGPLIGRLADRVGKLKVFWIGSVVSAVTVYIYTNMGITPLPQILILYAIMYTGVFSRMIPSQALISAIPDRAHRGSFMAVIASLQQMSGGIASIIAGHIVSQGADGKLEHFDIVGNVMVVTVTLTMVMMFYINRSVARTNPAGV